MPIDARRHTNNGDAVTFILANGSNQLIFPVYQAMVIQTLLCPSNLSVGVTTATTVEMSPDYELTTGVGTWYVMWSSGSSSTAAAAFTFSVGASRAVRFSPSDFYGANWIRVTFNANQSGSNAIFTTMDAQVTGT